jgi:hypothetical protein
LGAAAYAAKAAGLAAPDQQAAVAREIQWQLSQMSVPVEAALLKLPPLGEDSSGPLGPGLLHRGVRARSFVTCKPGSAQPDLTSERVATRGTIGAWSW